MKRISGTISTAQSHAHTHVKDVISLKNAFVIGVSQQAQRLRSINYIHILDI